MVAGLLAFMAVTGYAGMLNLKGIVPDLLPPDELFAGTPACFRLLLRNEKKRIPSFLIRLESPGNEATLLPFVEAGATLTSELHLTFQQRGWHSIGQIKVSSPFPVNFFTRFWNFRLTAACLVFPRLVAFSGAVGVDGSEQTGKTLHVRRGQDGELEGIRGYTGAEPLRAIHWKLSARDHDLLVKEFGSQSMQPLLIRINELPGTVLEERLSQAAWLIKQRGMEQPVGVVLDERTIPPGTGRHHCRQLLSELALYDHN